MPLPLIPVAVAVLAGSAFGLKKGANAVAANKEAKDIIDNARRVFEDAKGTLEVERQRTSRSLDELGQYRLDLWQRQLGRFVVLFRVLKNTHLTGQAATDGVVASFDGQVLPDMERRISDARAAMTSVAGGTLSGVAVGAGAALGTTTFAAASTGTAIAGLSGAAATNATLAWLGGGSLAAGGFGMAGGMVVLGGLVTAPVLAVGGFMLNKAMQAKLDQARSQRAEATVAAAEMLNVAKMLEGVCRVSVRFKDALEALDDRMTVMLGVLEQGMQSVGVDVALYSKPQRQFLRLLVETASYLKTMLETPILDEDGRLNPALSGAIQTAYLVNARAMAGAAS